MEIPVNDAPKLPDQQSVRDIARAFVEENHPGASASILGGSAASGTATSTSDLDIAILYPDGHPSYAQTTRFRGWLVETFVHTSASLEVWYQKESDERRPVIAELCASGILLTNDGSGTAWQSAARSQMAQGPRPLTGPERDSRRYGLSALIDDLSGSKTEADAFMLAADIFHDAADLLLLETGSWLGGGKWVVRRLALSDHELATRLWTWAANPNRDPGSLIGLAQEVLKISGGYIQEGFVRGSVIESA